MSILLCVWLYGLCLCLCQNRVQGLQMLQHAASRSISLILDVTPFKHWSKPVSVPFKHKKVQICETMSGRFTVKIQRCVKSVLRFLVTFFGLLAFCGPAKSSANCLMHGRQQKGVFKFRQTLSRAVQCFT